MEYFTLNSLGMAIDLNENPTMPGADNIIPPGGNNANGMINIGKFTVNSFQGSASEASLTDMLRAAKKDSAHE